MAYNKNCLAEIKSAIGRDLSQQDLDDISTLAEELSARIDEETRIRGGESLSDAIKKAADSYGAEIIESAKKNKRNAALDLRTRLGNRDFILSQFKTRPDIGGQAILVGTNYAKPGSRFSAAAEQDFLREWYLSGFLSDVEKLGDTHWRLFINGVLDRDIVNALYYTGLRKISKDPRAADAKLAGLRREAREIAEVMDKWQEVTRHHANDAGAYIKRRWDFIVSRTWDQAKVAKVTEEEFINDFKDRLDPQTFRTGNEIGPPNVDPVEWLKVAYLNLSSGVHLKEASVGHNVAKSGLARRVSAERVFQFKNADAWFEMNQKYGMGNLRESLIRGFESRAYSTALMRHLGPSGEDNFWRMLDEVMKETKDPAQRTRLRKASQTFLRHQMDDLTGMDRIVVDPTLATYSNGFRAIQRMSKLGLGVFAQIADIPIYATEHRYQGGNWLSGVAESIGNLTKGMPSRQMKEVLDSLAVYSDNVVGALAHRFSIGEDSIGGTLTKAQRLFFKYNGMTPWTDAQKIGAIASMSRRLAFNSGRKWGQLEPDYRRVLSMYGIQEKEWDIIRTTKQKAADGRNYITPDLISDELVARKVRAYIIDRAGYYVIMPNQQTRATMLRSTQPGTVEGTLVRHIGELKAFSASMTQKPMGRELFGRGAEPGATPYDSLYKAIRNGNGEILGLVGLFLGATMFGYQAMVAKDLVKGRKPRDPFDPKTFIAAALQGGGGAIYGDFLFGQVRTRYGQGLLSTLAGPTFGTIQDLADLWGRLREGDDAAAKAFKIILNNTPFINLFYVRPILDYLILWQIQETLNPGSLKRMESLIERENAQQFWMRPSEMVR